VTTQIPAPTPPEAPPATDAMAAVLADARTVMAAAARQLVQDGPAQLSVTIPAAAAVAPVASPGEVPSATPAEPLTAREQATQAFRDLLSTETALDPLEISKLTTLLPLGRTTPVSVEVGNMIYALDVTVRKAVPIETIIQALRSSGQGASQVLPRGTRWFDQVNPTTTIYTIEIPPHRLDVSAAASVFNADSVHLHDVRLAPMVPWTVLMVKVDRTNNNKYLSHRTFFRTSPLAGRTDALFDYLLPNMYDGGAHGRACMGRSFTADGLDLIQTVAMIERYHRACDFNTDLTWATNRLPPALREAALPDSLAACATARESGHALLAMLGRWHTWSLPAAGRSVERDVCALPWPRTASHTVATMLRTMVDER